MCYKCGGKTVTRCQNKKCNREVCNAHGILDPTFEVLCEQCWKFVSRLFKSNVTRSNRWEKWKNTAIENGFVRGSIYEELGLPKPKIDIRPR